ncbi:MAG: 4Fe-4S binding protein, partial [Anaerolineae bacterium]|nr:4Fe-4S binding protein [Anaerolineae bacterium]
MSNKLERRGFLKVAGASIVGLAGLQLMRPSKVSSEDTASGERQWAMVIDQSKCTGCGHCTLSCRAHNDVSPGISWNEVLPAGKVGEHQVFIARP